MGRRDHLVRIALAANQSQIQESATPSDSEDYGVSEEELAVSSKNEKIQKFDLAQGAVLSAIGFSSTQARVAEVESGEKDLLNVSSACQFVNYFLPLPLTSQRNQILVCPFLTSVTDFKAFRTYNSSYLSLLRGSWRAAGWSLFWIGHPSILVYQFGYSASMHYLQPRIVHNFRKLYPYASKKSVDALCMRLGVSLA
jgi:hypothetical protein